MKAAQLPEAPLGIRGKDTRQILEPLARELGLACADPPIRLAGFDVKQYWHARNYQSPAHQWMRQSLYRTLNGAIA